MSFPCLGSDQIRSDKSFHLSTFVIFFCMLYLVTFIRVHFYYVFLWVLGIVDFKQTSPKIVLDIKKTINDRSKK